MNALRGLVRAATLIVTMACTIACTKTSAERRADEVKTAQELVDSMIYVKNPYAANDCFVYLWQGGRGGPAMRTIDCEKVPPPLLIDLRQNPVRESNR